MSKLVLLERFAYTPMGVFGRLYIPEFECFTVERPWLDNKPNVSCIPEGDYTMFLGRYYKGGYSAYEIMDVPDRSLIKIHIGNTMDDLMGCIAPGTRLGYLENKWAVLSSRKAFTTFMRMMNKREESILRIINKCK